VAEEEGLEASANPVLHPYPRYCSNSYVLRRKR